MKLSQDTKAAIDAEIARFEGALPELEANRQAAVALKTDLAAQAKKELRAGRIVAAARLKLDAATVSRAIRALDDAVAKVRRRISELSASKKP